MQKKQSNIKLRRAVIEDLPEIRKVFVESINAICAKDYNSEQLNVWTAGIKNEERWLNKIKNQYFLVAEFDKRIAGFGSLDKGYYIDFMYVHQDYQGKGIAGILLTALEKESQRYKTRVLKSDVSKTAVSFFKKKGFEIIKEQKKFFNGIEIDNFKMEKILNFPSAG